MAGSMAVPVLAIPAAGSQEAFVTPSLNELCVLLRGLRMNATLVPN